MERPQRGQCARAQRSSCWPHLQSVERLRRAWFSVIVVLVTTVLVLSVRLTSLISHGSRPA
jgi:hypothetical protein